MNMTLIIFIILLALFTEIIYWVFMFNRDIKFLSGKTLSIFIAILPTTLCFLVYLLFKQLEGTVDPEIAKIVILSIVGIGSFYLMNYGIYRLIKSKKK